LLLISSVIFPDPEGVGHFLLAEGTNFNGTSKFISPGLGPLEELEVSKRRGYMLEARGN